jgi:hypothetical protein
MAIIRENLPAGNMSLLSHAPDLTGGASSRAQQIEEINRAIRALGHMAAQHWAAGARTDAERLFHDIEALVQKRVRLYNERKAVA